MNIVPPRSRMREALCESREFGQVVLMNPVDRALSFAFANPANRRIAEAIPALAGPDSWLVSGCVFQSIWNGLSGRDPSYGILDYDVFYFDQDVSYEAEDAVIRACAAATRDLGVEVQVRNQGRVHLWYPQKFGRPYPAVASVEEALRRFLAPACAVGIRIKDGTPELLAPFGIEDVFARRIRRNVLVGGSPEQYDAKTARWKAVWPEITVEPWDAE
jgi:uncharacterized protein